MLMAHDERRGPGSRLIVEMPIKARWFDGTLSGKMIESAGVTLNISPSGTLIKMDRLPEIGTMLLISLTREELKAKNQKHGLESFKAALKGIVLWAEERDAAVVAAIELDFTGGEEASQQMTYWMDKIYEPLAIQTVLEEQSVAESVCS
ncbi:MAG: hypothetical protein WKF30_01540 [Pyrinomonadaceae bacterium]